MNSNIYKETKIHKPFVEMVLAGIDTNVVEPITLHSTSNLAGYIATFDIEEVMFKSKFAKFYNLIATKNPDFILATDINKLWDLLKNGQACLTFHYNPKSKMLEIVSFAKLYVYENVIVNGEVREIEETDGDDLPRIKVMEVGNVMTSEKWARNHLGLRIVIDTIKIAMSYCAVDNADKPYGFWPIAVVHNDNFASNRLFQKLEKLGLAKRLPVWPKEIEHSKHGGQILENESVYDLTQAVRYAEQLDLEYVLGQEA